MMNKRRRDKALDSLQTLGKRYVREYLEHQGWEQNRLKKDWFYAFKFFIQHLYYQGRRDELSARFFESMWSCLQNNFMPDPTKILDASWEQQQIPHDPDWEDEAKEGNPLWDRFDRTMGKTRDREMVLDCLRYIHGIDQYNVVRLSLKAIEENTLLDHRCQLMKLWGVGPKTSAFYLRDIVLLFDLKVAPADFLALQPVDTWVQQVVQAITKKKLGHCDVEKWLIHQAPKYDVALINAGAWYIGKNAFPLALSLVAEGELSEERLNSMDFGDFDG